MVICHDEQFGLIFTDNNAGAAALCILLIGAKHCADFGDAPVCDGDNAGKAVVGDRSHICRIAVVVEGIGCTQGIRSRGQ